MYGSARSSCGSRRWRMLTCGWWEVRMDLKLMRVFARAAAVSFEVTFKMFLVDSFAIFGVFIQPLIVAALALWMLRGLGGDYAIFVVVGSGLTGLWSTLLFAGGNS